MAKITILAEENCVSSSIVGSMDAFAIANMWWMFSEEGAGAPLFETEIVTVDGKPVRANGGILLEPVMAMTDVEATDLIMLPAFFPPFGQENARRKKIYAWLRERHGKGETIAATCTGTFLLAETGMLDNRTATTNWHFAGMFQRQYPDVDLRVDRIITEDDRLICTGAASAFLNLCLLIIERYGSADLAAQCSRALLIDPDRQSQAPYMVHSFWKDHSDGQVLEAQRWMEENLSDKVSIDEVAGRVGISSRHFKRRFKAATGENPLSYLQHLRIEKAKQRLQTSLDTVNEITWQVGYEDINSFRRLFIKHTGMSPKGYRNKYAHLSGIL